MTLLVHSQLKSWRQRCIVAICAFLRTLPDDWIATCRAGLWSPYARCGTGHQFRRCELQRQSAVIEILRLFDLSGRLIERGDFLHLTRAKHNLSNCTTGRLGDLLSQRGMNKKHDAGLSQVPNNCQALLGDANYAEMHSPNRLCNNFH